MYSRDARISNPLIARDTKMDNLQSREFDEDRLGENGTTQKPTCRVSSDSACRHLNVRFSSHEAALHCGIP